MQCHKIRHRLILQSSNCILPLVHNYAQNIKKKKRKKRSQLVKPVKKYMHWEGFYIHSEMQVPTRHAHLAAQPNHVMLETTHYASMPMTNFLWLASLYNYLSSNLPKAPHDAFMRALALLAIFAIYSLATVRCIIRLCHYKVCSIIWPPVLPIKRRAKRDKCPTLPKMHIKLFATSTKKTPQSFDFGSDGIPFVMDNSATGAICNEKSLFVGPFTYKMVTVETAEGEVTRRRQVGTLRF